MLVSFFIYIFSFEKSSFCVLFYVDSPVLNVRKKCVVFGGQKVLKRFSMKLSV